MEDRYLFRGKRIDNGEWVEGYLSYPFCTKKCKYEYIVMSVPPERMNLKLQLSFSLHDHMTEQQDKIATSIKDIGIIQVYYSLI